MPILQVLWQGNCHLESFLLRPPSCSGVLHGHCHHHRHLEYKDEYKDDFCHYLWRTSVHLKVCMNTLACFIVSLRLLCVTGLLGIQKTSLLETFFFFLSCLICRTCFLPRSRSSSACFLFFVNFFPQEASFQVHGWRNEFLDVVTAFCWKWSWILSLEIQGAVKRYLYCNVSGGGFSLPCFQERLVIQVLACKKDLQVTRECLLLWPRLKGMFLKWTLTHQVLQDGNSRCRLSCTSCPQMSLRCDDTSIILVFYFSSVIHECQFCLRLLPPPSFRNCMSLLTETLITCTCFLLVFRADNKYLRVKWKQRETGNHIDLPITTRRVKKYFLLSSWDSHLDSLQKPFRCSLFTCQFLPLSLPSTENEC